MLFKKLLEIKENLKKSSKSPKASIIIVSYESLDLLTNCIDSIFKYTNYPNYELIIIDNNSGDSVKDYLIALKKNSDQNKVKIILNDQNLGFAKANNQGLLLATDPKNKETKNTKFLVLLNNDTVVTPGWLDKLIYYASIKENGLVGPVTNNIGNEAKIETTYSTMEEMVEFSVEREKKFKNQFFEYRVPAMFCICFRKDTYQKLGPLDEGFELGMFEDDDYAKRVSNIGLKCICAEDIFIHHVGSASFSKLDKEYYQQIFNKNKQKYEEKWGKWIPHVYRVNNK